MGSTSTTTRRPDARDVTDTAELPVVRPDPDESRRDTDETRTEVVPVERATADRVTAAPAVADPATPDAPAAPVARKVPRTVWFFVILAVLGLSAALGISLVIRAVGDANPFKNGIVHSTTIDRSGPAVLQAVTDLGTLQSASGHYEMVVDLEHSVDHVPSFLAGRRVLFVAVGDVDTSVDLRGLPAGAVTVDSSRTAATIHLPKPRLSQPHLDLQRSHVYSSDRGIVDAVGDALNGGPDQQQELYTLATQRLSQAAAANGELVNRAEANTRTTLQGLLKPLGFTDVTVVFDR
jgi:hypothetical protein